MNFELITDPLLEMDRFRERAEAEGLALPEAMTLATVGLDGGPRARVVLLKGRRGRELHFYTNYESDKARELDHEPRAALCIHYPTLAVQTRIEGTVVRLSEQESDAYFATRPRDSQLGAWASHQSRPLARRVDLDTAMDREQQRFEGRAVPRPSHWGGYGLTAHMVELWIGQGARLHDRARYVWEVDHWGCTRLQP